MNSLPNALIAVLNQGIYLLDAVDDVVYNRTLSQAFGASVGVHYRHCLDHFQSLVDGVGGVVDYDARPRDVRLETDRAFARGRTRELEAACGAIRGKILSAGVEVRCKVCPADIDSPVVHSTAAREAMYAVVHAIHHYALISVMCRMQGVELSDSFGVAPSTQYFRATCGSAPIAPPPMAHHSLGTMES